MSSEVRSVLLVDADAFYVSVARLLDPDGAGRAKYLIVGGSPTGRGVVTSASYEARAFGVRSAMPSSQAKRLCPDATFVGVPRGECSARSRAIREVLEEFTPIVEAASIDEFYLDMTGTEQLHGEPLEATAVRIRERVVERTGISVSIGGGSGKLIAKLAAKRAKPHRDESGRGVRLIPTGTELDFMKSHDLAEIPQIGPRFTQRLRRMGLVTVKDVIPIPTEELQRLLGERSGAWLYRRVRGLDSSAVVAGHRRKSLSHEGTFAKDLSTWEELNRELVSLASRVAHDLRSKSLMGRTVSVKLKYSDFTVRQASTTLSEPVSTDGAIIDQAQQLLRKLRRARGGPARLIGVAASQLVARGADHRQLSLFDDPEEGLETKRDRALSESLDRITDRFGWDGIVRGAQKKPGRRIR